MMLCKRPIYVYAAGGLVPCGQCLHCRSNARRKKTTRMLLESLTHEDALFVTLTYSDEFLPRDLYDSVTGELIASHPTGCLDKRAVQLFLKRLRKKFPPKSIRYFVAGEYGEKRGRPHYHFVIWGIPYSRRNDIYDSWCDPHTGKLMCNPDFLDVQVPRDSWAVSQYCCSYLMKRMTAPDDARLVGRPPEFCQSSQGIGKPSLDLLVRAFKTPSAQAFIAINGDIPRAFVSNGKTFPIDRYMREKLIDALQITESAKAVGRAKYEEEMSALRSRSSFDKTFSSSELLDPAGMSRSNFERYKKTLINQYVSEKAPELIAAEHRADLYRSQKGEF